MAYSDFTLDGVTDRFSLRLVRDRLFPNAVALTPGAWLMDALNRGRLHALASEKARSELIVAPILVHCGDFVGDNYAIYSGMDLDVDPVAGLKGPCDFILGGTRPMPVLRDPLMVLVEAKKGDIDAGLPQCAAQMVAARRFNQARKNPHERIHGCVTTGTDWQFLRLDGDALVIDTDLYYLSDLGKILGVLSAVMKGQTS